jgi:hypothetical protein
MLVRSTYEVGPIPCLTVAHQVGWLVFGDQVPSAAWIGGMNNGLELISWDFPRMDGGRRYGNQGGILVEPVNPIDLQPSP